MAKNYANIAKEVLRLVGGDKNVSVSYTHLTLPTKLEV